MSQTLVQCFSMRDHHWGSRGKCRLLGPSQTCGSPLLCEYDPGICSLTEFSGASAHSEIGKPWTPWVFWPEINWGVFFFPFLIPSHLLFQSGCSLPCKAQGPGEGVAFLVFDIPIPPVVRLPSMAWKTSPGLDEMQGEGLGKSQGAARHWRGQGACA